MGDSKNSHSCRQSCGRFGRTPTTVSSHVPTSWFLSTVPVFSVCGLQVCCALLPVMGFAAFGATLGFTLAFDGPKSAVCHPKAIPGDGLRAVRTKAFTFLATHHPSKFFPHQQLLRVTASLCPLAVARPSPASTSGLVSREPKSTLNHPETCAGHRSDSHPPDEGEHVPAEADDRPGPKTWTTQGPCSHNQVTLRSARHPKAPSRPDVRRSVRLNIPHCRGSVGEVLCGPACFPD